MAGGDLAMGQDGKDIGKATRPVILRLWNAYVFFTLYADIDGVTAKFSTGGTDALDRYILAKTRDMVSAIERKLDAFDIPGAYEQVNPYIEALNNWYIRNRRATFWSNEDPADKQAAYDTLYTCLL
jgi:isoleucyl-tRNA synthetase